MKINKWTIFICVIMLIISGVLVYMISDVNTKTYDLALGVFTGFLVSLVIAIVNYLHQKYLIYNSVMTQISDIFINTYIIHCMTGMILEKVQNLNKLDDLNYRSILGMADLNIGFATGMNTKLFVPIVGIGKKYQAIIEMMEFENDLSNLKFCIGKIQSYSLEHDLLQVEMTQRPPTQEEIALLQSKRCLVLVQTAKLHEYEASLLQKIDKIATPFYGKNENSWINRKNILFAQAERIMQQNK